ncbi:Putative protein ZNRD1-AS1 like protein [Myotis brandtii]|uniref:Uncharacterized protein n=1 Tax=Myotis brandtii TaxID=109478 RepID=S7NG14_MYOBR|nr:Putative protein ZNRD1-AS1 like protein [Myotis brandtii]
MLEDAWEYFMLPKRDFDRKEEGKRIQSEKTGDDQRWDYLVSEKELDQIKKHIHQAERARGLRDHKYRQPPQKSPCEILSPKTFTQEHEKTENFQRRPRAKTKQHQVAWLQEQMQRHRERMIRGRELAEQRKHKRDAQKLAGQAPPLLKPQVRKEEVKEFEQITAYPLVQPRWEAPIEVTVLREKSRESNVKKPLRRQLLRIPPFLRSQLEKKIKTF